MKGHGWYVGILTPHGFHQKRSIVVEFLGLCLISLVASINWNLWIPLYLEDPTHGEEGRIKKRLQEFTDFVLFSVGRDIHSN